MTKITSQEIGEPLAILAAGGAIPVEVARAASDRGRKVLVIGLEGEADARLRSFPYEALKWGQIGRIPDIVTSHGARDIVLIGSVTSRPDFRNIGLDLNTLKFLPRILGAMIGGDDSVLGNFVRFLEEQGFRVLGAHDVAPALVATPGQVAGPRPSRTAIEDARVAMEATVAIGARDIGQAAVAVNGLVLAVEAAEGTDAMLARVADLRASGRVKWSGRAGALAKCAKPQQDLRVDMPTIGPRTVQTVVAAGLAGIVIQAGRVMIAEREQTIRAASDSGTFILAAADPATPLAP